MALKDPNSNPILVLSVRSAFVFYEACVTKGENSLIVTLLSLAAGNWGDVGLEIRRGLLLKPPLASTPNQLAASPHRTVAEGGVEGGGRRCACRTAERKVRVKERDGSIRRRTCGLDKGSGTEAPVDSEVVVVAAVVVVVDVELWCLVAVPKIRTLQHTGAEQLFLGASGICSNQHTLTAWVLYVGLRGASCSSWAPFNILGQALGDSEMVESVPMGG